jgi:transcriptional regulator with XRE-family HTH domain
VTLADVAERMGIEAPALSRLETGKMLNPTLATLHKWAQALGRRLEVELAATDSGLFRDAVWTSVLRRDGVQVRWHSKRMTRFAPIAENATFQNP